MMKMFTKNLAETNVIFPKAKQKIMERLHRKPGSFHCKLHNYSQSLGTKMPYTKELGTVGHGKVWSPEMVDLEGLSIEDGGSAYFLQCLSKSEAI